MTRLLIAMTVCLAALTGCGGGDDGDGSDGGGPSREAFVADANAICRDGEKKIEEVTAERQQELSQASSEAEQRKVIGDLLEKTADAYRPYLDRLRDLEPPEDLAESWSSFTEGVTKAFDLIPQLAEATRDNDEERLKDLTDQFSDIAGDTRPFAERAGLDDCLPDEGTQ
jgi:chromosome segregation ATPase